MNNRKIIIARAIKVLNEKLKLEDRGQSVSDRGFTNLNFTLQKNDQGEFLESIAFMSGQYLEDIEAIISKAFGCNLDAMIVPDGYAGMGHSWNKVRIPEYLFEAIASGDNEQIKKKINEVNQKRAAVRERILAEEKTESEIRTASIKQRFEETKLSAQNALKYVNSCTDYKWKIHVDEQGSNELRLFLCWQGDYKPEDYAAMITTISKQLNMKIELYKGKSAQGSISYYLRISGRQMEQLAEKSPVNNSGKKAPYKIILGEDVLRQLSAYKADLIACKKVAGKRLSKNLCEENISRMTDERFLELLIQTKKPREFAEALVLQDSIDWSDDELRILGNIGIAVEDVSIYDNGVHQGAALQPHKQPFAGTLLFVPGAVLTQDSHTQKTLPDYRDIHNQAGEIDDDKLYHLYETRLLPLLVHANEKAKQNYKKAFITIPGIGCGVFAGIYKGELGNKLAVVLDRLLEKHGAKFANIQAIYYDPYLDAVKLNNSYKNGRKKIHNIDFMIRGQAIKSQLLPPAMYEENGDNFSQCELFSCVAWDHVSWPGNDFYRNNDRSTDDGVKAAATATMKHMTGIEGGYDHQDHKYYPPAKYADWETAIRENNLQLRVKGNVQVAQGYAIGKMNSTQNSTQNLRAPSSIKKPVKLRLDHFSPNNTDKQSFLNEHPIIAKISGQIEQLEKEINSCWPYPNKDLKQIKVDALENLKMHINELINGDNDEIVNALNAFEANYPSALKGKLSNRTRDLIQDIRQMISKKSHEDTLLL